MRRGWGWIGAVWVLACLASAWGQVAGGVTAQPLTPGVEAAPGTTVTLRLRLDNFGDERVAFTPEVTPPIGWRVLVPPGEVRLDAGTSSVALITLLVPADTEARAYVFPVGYRLDRDDPRQEAHFTVLVPSVDGVSLTLLEAPEYVTDAVFVSRFLVRNESNVRHTFALTTRGDGALALRVEPASVDLAPGAAVEVLVHAAVPDDLTDSLRHVTTLEVAHPDLPEVRATARATSTLVPRSPPRAPRHHTFPLTARVAGGVHHDGTAGAGPTVELTGAGPLTDHGAGRLNVRLKTPLADPTAVEEFVVDYRGADGRVSVGRRSFLRSPLASGERGLGVRVERTWRLAARVDVTGAAQVYDGPDGWGATTSAHATIADDVHVGGTLHASGEDLFATVEAGYRPRAAGARGLELAALEAAYAVRLGVATASPSGSLRFHARLREGPSNVDLRYARADAGFSDAATHRAQLDLKAALRLNAALDLDPSSPVDLHLAYASDDAWTGPRGAGAASSRSLGGTLTARLGVASVSVGHRHGWRREAGVPDWDATTHLQAYLPVGDGADLRQRVSWIRTPRDDQVRYEGDVSVRTSARGRLTASIDANVLLGSMRVDALVVGARWAGAASETLSLDARLHLDLLGSGDRASLSLGGRQRFANGHELDVEATGTLRADGRSTTSVDVGYAVPIHLPIGRRTDIGTIRGHVRTPGGEPLEGVLVAAAGGMAVTDAEGAFALQAVPPGRQLVALVPSTIPIDDPVVTPSPPTWLDVVAGEATAVTFRIEAGATVTGRLVPSEPAGGSGREAVGPDTDADRWLSGAIVELSDGSTTRRAVTDASGAFRLASVPAGAWTVRLRHPSLPDDFRIEPAIDGTVQLRPGAIEHVEFRLVPVQRTIRFQDGGRLGGSGGAD